MIYSELFLISYVSFRIHTHFNLTVQPMRMSVNAPGLKIILNFHGVADPPATILQNIPMDQTHVNIVLPIVTEQIPFTAAP